MEAGRQYWHLLESRNRRVCASCFSRVNIKPAKGEKRCLLSLDIDRPSHGRVQNSVGDPIPEFDQHSEEGSKRPSFVNRQDAGDVLPHHPMGPNSISKSSKLEGEVATRVIQSRSFSGDGERLGRRGDCSSGQKVDCSDIVFSYLGKVTEVHNSAVDWQRNHIANRSRTLLRFLSRIGYVRTWHVQRARCAIARVQQPATKRVDLGEHHRLPAERLPRHGNCFDARTHGKIFHAHRPCLPDRVILSIPLTE